MDYNKYYKYTFKLDKINLDDRCIASKIYNRDYNLGYVSITIYTNCVYLDVEERRRFASN